MKKKEKDAFNSMVKAILHDSRRKLTNLPEDPHGEQGQWVMVCLSDIIKEVKKFCAVIEPEKYRE